jgi:transposase
MHERRPDHAQVDFSETLGTIGGLECKIHFYVMSLPHSDAVFVKGYPTETTEAFCDGHVSAFAFFGGIPQTILYDNTKIAVARILGDRTRVRTQRFTELQSHYLIDGRFGRPARENDKGNVEGMVGFTRRNFKVPPPRFNSFDDLNAHLEQRCLERQGDKLRGHEQTIGNRLISNREALMGLPVAEYEACVHVSTRATSISTVRYRSNDYSVPVTYAHHDVHVRGFVHECHHRLRQ